ncbi:hypothetical protein BOG92_000635 [Streptomyces sp. WAC00263]|nr:hypothetical protein BOG92_000635 [Streptomyces sp. WAC00263]
MPNTAVIDQQDRITALIVGGASLKAGGVPGHFWVPDAVQGSVPPVATFLTTLPKIGAFAALYRLAAEALSGTDVPWAALVAVVSMTLGNLAASFQQDVKRLLVHSTISQVGYLLMPAAVAGRADLAQQALLFHLAGYALTNPGAFAVVCALPGLHDIDGYRELACRRPALAGSLVVCLLGLVGTPPTAVFLGKLEAFSAAFDGGYSWLAVVGAVNTVASFFYYLHWIAPAVAAGRSRKTPEVVRTASVTAYAAAAGSAVPGLAGGLVLALLDGSLAR